MLECARYGREVVLYSVICLILASRGAKHFEDWERQGKSNGTTTLPVMWHSLQKRVLTGLDTLVALGKDQKERSATSTGSKNAGLLIRNLNNTLAEYLKHQLIESIHNTVESLCEEFENEAQMRKVRLSYDLTNLQTDHLLLTVGNLCEIRDNFVPRLINQLENYLKISMTSELKDITLTITEYEGHLESMFIKDKVASASSIVDKGIKSVDWASLQSTSEVQPYILQVLLLLVEIHAEMSHTCSSARIDYILSRVVSALISAVYSTYEQVRRLGLRGMLQSTLDVEFLHQTVTDLITPDTHEVLRQLYALIENRFDKSSNAQNLKGELENVKRFLNITKRNTANEFACLRRTKDKPTNDRNGREPRR